jgi:hypothetical protein
MRVINVIEVENNKVNGMESFGIEEEQFSADVVREAEEAFYAKAVENGFSEDRNDIAEHIENGYWENGDYAVMIVWSDI